RAKRSRIVPWKSWVNWNSCRCWRCFSTGPSIMRQWAMRKKPAARRAGKKPCGHNKERTQMSMSWEREYKKRLKEADEALECVKSGMRVYIQPGCAEPEALVEALIRRAP